MRVLVVEDEAKVARALKEGLERERYDVALARTGEDGFYRVQAETFDLVILDLVILRQALINLLHNAIQHSPEAERVSVRIGRRAPRDVVFEVEDRGRGIPAEHRERVFERFYRVDPGRSREQGGTGLGLAIAEWAVKAHGGAIELESHEDRGSTFRVILPEADGPGQYESLRLPSGRYSFGEGRRDHS